MSTYGKNTFTSIRSVYGHCGCLTIRRPGVVSAGGNTIVCRLRTIYARHQR